MSTPAPLLEVQHLKTYFHSGNRTTKAVDDLSITLYPGQTLGLVGESGSGKSVTSLSIMRLLPDVGAKIEEGEVVFLEKDLVRLPKRQMRKIRGAEISMIFQEPESSLNPVFKVGDQVMEAIRLHQRVSKRQAREKTIELFREVGIRDPERRIKSYPHQMSGGQKQRVMIAMALSCNPKILIADEPTTALDVTIQKQILDLIRKLRDERGMAVLFITHDLGVIGEIADTVAVMYKGKLVEYRPVVDIFQNPQHPYTKGLLNCRPQLDSPYKRLPTVSDFMDVTFDAKGDVVHIRELEMDQARLQHLKTDGRDPLLHPASQLKELGYSLNKTDYKPGTNLVPEDTQPLLEVNNLKVHFPIRKGIFQRVVDYVKAVDDVSFKVYPGQTLGLVGESGSGKTTTGRAILRLVGHDGGQALYQGKDLLRMGGGSLRKMRRKLQIIFQDPYNSLNPRMTVQAMLTEVMGIHRLGGNKEGRRDRAASLLEEVGLSAEVLNRYPHEFSGGQRQRLCIARALAVEPEFIICDESVSALDVSVQAQVLNLLKDLQRNRNLTYIFISHDLNVVKFMSDMMVVMQEGKVVEQGPAEAIYKNPKEAYTRSLIEAIPDNSLENIQRRQAERHAALQKRQPVAAG